MSIWQIAIVVTIVLGTAYNLVAKSVANKASMDRPLVTFLGRLVALYVGGLVCGLAMLQWQLPPPNFSIQLWVLFIIEGIAIPASAMATYFITARIGAGGAALISTLFTMIAAIIGAIILNESTSHTLLIGSALIVSSVFLVAKSSTKSTDRSMIRTRSKAPKSLLHSKVVHGRNGLWYAILIGCLFFPAGVISEKIILDQIGVWIYCIYGWGFQLLGVILLLAIFGKNEFSNKKEVFKSFNLGMILGLVLLLKSIPCIYAISVGQFGGTSIALIGRVALTFFCSAIIFKEYQNIVIRILACIASIVGVALVLI